MIRQAHKYLVGAMSGATLIAIAIVAFVMLVSAQVFHDWPIAALGNDDSGSVSQAKPVQGPEAGGATTTASVVSTAPGLATARQGKGPASSGNGGAKGAISGPGSIAAGEPGGEAAPGSEAGSGGGPEGAGGGQPAQGSPSGSAGSSSGGSSGSGGSGGGNGSGSSPESGSTAASTPTGQVTGTVNEAVHQVDQTALGGTLEKTGVTEVTEGVVNGVVGPESTVGHVVDETVGAVGGLLGGKH